MSSIGPSADAIKKLLKNNTLLDIDANGVIMCTNDDLEKKGGHELLKLRDAHILAIQLKKTFATADNSITRDQVIAFHQIVLSLLTPEQVLGLDDWRTNILPSTVATYAYTQLYWLHFIVTNWWEPLHTTSSTPFLF
jgi:hypothetical protein